jgi:lipopolysaccharide/colanic/teichoic acid biosynthesis glycosyltransferase
MATYPVLLDAHPAYLGHGRLPRSLLLTPLGRSTLLERWLCAVSPLSRERCTVLVPFTPSPAYRAAISAAAGHELSVLPVQQFAELVRSREPSDWLLLADAAHPPIDGADLAAQLKRRYGTASAIHLVSAARGACDAHECVHLDDDGCVRRIQRYYQGVTWQATCGICCSLVSVAAIQTLPPMALATLPALRHELARQGIVARDICLKHGGIDLCSEHALLTFSEQAIRELTADSSSASIDVGNAGRIHPTARLLGHVVVQAGATVEAGARIIGPTLLGAGAQVGAEACVAQSVVLPGAIVPSQATVRGRVFGGAEDRALSLEIKDSAAPAAGQFEAPAAAAEADGAYVRVKRVLDCVVAAVGLAMLTPLLAVVAALVRFTSRGPVFFGHHREGLGGKEFRCWKFRTMVADADAQQRALYEKNKVDGPQFKLENDPRITRVGNWLRKTNIDELPQLVNVVLGQMSLIGPRPSPFRENQICVPWRQARLSVRPGITGLWQLCRHDREAGDFHQWIHFDMLYVRHISFWLDLKILFGTLATFGGRWSIPLTRMISQRTLRGAATLPLRSDWIPLSAWPASSAVVAADVSIGSAEAAAAPLVGRSRVGVDELQTEQVA